MKAYWTGHLTWGNGREDGDFLDHPTADAAIADMQTRLSDFTPAERDNLASATVVEFVEDPKWPSEAQSARQIDVPID